jgi:biotin carboxyl carrier protein
MKYTVTVDGEVFEVELRSGGRAWVNQKLYQVDLRNVGGGDQYSLLMNHRSYEVHVAESEDGEHHLLVGGRPYRACLCRGHRDGGGNGWGGPVASSPRRNLRPASTVELRAPLPGLLVETHVGEGDHVEEQDVVAVLESMKMNLEVRAPRSGVVCDILATPGRHVAQDEVLATISPGSDSRSKSVG